ncbi:helix-turn-helix transcriptional regulator [Candidatus Curtissbacteria bacterium]|nr:helix-turn-helix transcriptional regulator [Candidatus Curtissbacteria bacterium]
MVEGNGKRAEAPVRWPYGIRKRHVELLQVVLDREDRTPVHESLGLVQSSAKNLISGINQVFGGDKSRIDGVALAIVFGIKHGLLNTENIPDIGEVELKGRDAEILALMMRGFRTSFIAYRLSLSPRTVQNYERDMCRRLGLKNKYRAVAAGLKVLQEAGVI